MAKVKIDIIIEAPDLMQAELMRMGAQNVINALAEHQNFLVELSDPAVCNSYKNKITGLINNPAIKALAKGFKGF